MKIALIIQIADRRKGGAEQYTLDLAARLAEKGHELTVVAAVGPAVPQETDEGIYRRVYLGAAGLSRWNRLADFLRRAREHCDSQGYDIVHAMMPVWRCDVYQPHAGLALDSWLNGHMKHRHWIARSWARRLNRYHPKRRGLARVECDMMSHGPWVLCLSSAMRDFARERFRLAPQKLVSLMNGVDLARFDPQVGRSARQSVREKWRVGERQRLGLLVGHNWRLKGLHESLEALRRINDPRIVLMVVGRDDVRFFEKHAARLGVRDRVLFAGSVNDPRPLYGAADFLLLPTRRDTCSLVVLEALAMGLPVITTRQNGAAEVIRDGREGVILDQPDADELARALEGMLDDDRVQAMSKSALAMRGTLSMEHHVQCIEEVYRQVAAARSGRAGDA